MVSNKNEPNCGHLRYLKKTDTNTNTNTNNTTPFSGTWNASDSIGVDVETFPPIWYYFCTTKQKKIALFRSFLHLRPLVLLRTISRRKRIFSFGAFWHHRNFCARFFSRTFPHVNFRILRLHSKCGGCGLQLTLKNQKLKTDKTGGNLHED